MQPFWCKYFGNPASLYKFGREADVAIEKARNTVASILKCRVGEIVFTAGATESINLALFGIARNYKPNAKNKYHIITSQIEHHAVLESLKQLEKEGFEVTYLPVNSFGFVSSRDLAKAIKPATILVSIMYANNEIGTIEPIAQLSKIIHKTNRARKASQPKIVFHTDACQAAGYLDINVQKLGVDLLTLNGSKIYGPKQTGILYCKHATELKPFIFGGGQEKGLRSGTENVPGIVGLAEALKLVQKNKNKENARLKKLRDYFIIQVSKKIPHTNLHGPDERSLYTMHKEIRLPNNINISFSGVDGEALMLYLDSYNIAVSTGSACASATTDPSHVILAIGKSPEIAKASIRFTLGQSTTKQKLDYVLNVLPGIVAELRRVQS